MTGAEPWKKRILQFQASELVPREQSERHYLEVHSAWALREIRAMDDMVAYHTNLMLGQWDLLGSFTQAPDLWRFATMRSRPDAPGGFPAWVIPYLSADHENFLRELRGFQVTESVLVDRRSGQLTSDKYVVVIDRPASLERADALRLVEEIETGLTTLLSDAYGARMLVTNRVLDESEYDDGREPGQQITPRRKESERLAYLELYFDHQEWGEEFFARTDLRELLVRPELAPGWLAAYHALERAGHDKR